jgi:hypothetical protein
MPILIPTLLRRLLVLLPASIVFVVVFVRRHTDSMLLDLHPLATTEMMMIDLISMDKMAILQLAAMEMDRSSLACAICSNSAANSRNKLEEGYETMSTW